MAVNFVISGGQISRPTHIRGITPDVELNGIAWNSQIGLFYHIDPTLYTPIKPPTPVPTQGPIPGKYGLK